MSGTDAWTFHGREGCDCCSGAAGLLMALVRGLPITVQMVGEPATNRRGGFSIPALIDPGGRVVWEGAFDSEATRMALEAWGVIRLGDLDEGVLA
jgi:hypothetical protein